jgi:transposase
MLIFGVDAQKRSHTIVAVDDHGRQRNVRTIATTTATHLDALCWAQRLGEERLWAN